MDSKSLFRKMLTAPSVKHQIVNHSQRLIRALGNIILSHSWLTSYLHTVELSQALVQAVHPKFSTTLQLPHVPPTFTSSPTIRDMALADDAMLEKTFAHLTPQQRQELSEVAANWPMLELISADFKGLQRV